MIYALSTEIKLNCRDDCCFMVNEQRGSLFLLNNIEGFILSLLNARVEEVEVLNLIATTLSVDAYTARQLYELVVTKHKHIIVESDIDDITSFNPDYHVNFLKVKSPLEDPYSFLDTPLVISIAVTRKCNISCNYCYHKTDNNVSIELTPEILLSVMHQAHSNNVKVIYLTGGEPFLHPAIYEAINISTNNKILTVISTNGTCIDVSKLSNCNKTYLIIQVSLEANTEKLYRHITNSCLFDSVVNNIKKLLSKGFKVRTKSVITDDNVTSCYEIISFIQNLGIKSMHISPSNNGLCKGTCADSSKTIVSNLEALKTEVYKIRDSMLAEIVYDEGYKDWHGNKDIIKCGNIQFGIAILASGKVTFCELNKNEKLCYGDIYQSRLHDIWNNQKHHQLNYNLLSKSSNRCKTCEYYSSCRSGCFMNTKYVRHYEDNRCRISST